MEYKKEYRYGTELLCDEKIFAEKRDFCETSILHSHSYYEIEFIEEGEGTLYVNGNSFPISKAMVHLANPLDYHQLTANDTIKLINISFSLDGTNTDLVETVFGNALVKTITLSEQDLQNCVALSSVILCEQKRGNKDGVVETCFESILKIVARYIPTSDEQTSLISKAMRFVQANFKQPLTLESVAHEIGFSKQYLSALFHKASGMSFKQYLTTIRITHAKRLLETTALNLTDVCFECGFGSYSGFYRAFEKNTGKSPQQTTRYKG